MASNTRNTNNILSEDDSQEVNKIFSNNTIEQIAVICGQMQQNVKQTRLELRNMIGNRHRELIDSCGELVGIDKVCRELVSMCDETHNQHQQHREKNRSTASSSSTASTSISTSSKMKNKGEENNNKDNNNCHHHDEDGKKQKWIDEQMLRAMRASSLLRESELFDAAVQISILERDVSLGIQSLLNNNNNKGTDDSSSSSSSLSLPPRFHALQATVKPLRDQWATAASKKLARITNNNSKNNTTSEQQQQHLVILASCFQGWGLLSRGGSPRDSLEYLLLFDSSTSSSSSTSLCKKTIDRIKSSSSSTTEAVTRISRLLKFVSEFLIDLYERGPSALISPSTNATTILNNEKKSVSNSFGIVPTLENASQEAASSFLSQLSHQVCALGMLDAEKSLSINNNNNNNKSQQPSLGWASPVMSPSPNNDNNSSSPPFLNNNNNNKMISANNNKSGSDLPLPTIPESLEIFEKCCKTLFAPILTSLIEKATDPSNGETSCLKILSSSSSSSSNGNKNTTSSSSSSSSTVFLQLTQKIQSILQLQVSNVISNAAGTCILQHLSQSAKDLVDLAKPLTASALSPTTSVNNNNEQHATPALLFQTIRSFIFPSTNQNSNNYNQSSSLLSFGFATNKIGNNNTNRGKLLLSSLMNRPLVLKGNNGNEHQQDHQKASIANNRNMTSRSASPAFSGASSSATTLLHRNNLTKINHHLSQTIKHTLSAIQRCISLSPSTSSTNSNISEIFNNITKIILDLTKDLEIATKKFVTNNSNSNNNDQEYQEITRIQIGITAAESLRYIVEPLTNLFSPENVVKMIKQQQSSASTIFTNNNNNNNNINESVQILRTNQSEFLAAWKNFVKKSFDSELFSSWINRNNNNHNVLSASELICKTDLDNSNSNSIKYPNRPSPSTLAALVNLVKKSTSLFSPINNDSSSTSETFCPLHVRVELCSELSLQVLKKAMDLVVTSSVHHQNDHKSTDQDQQLLQLYFDVCFIIMVLRGNTTSTSSSSSSSSFAVVDVLRRDFVKQVESTIDVVTWSVTKLNVNSAIKSAVDDSYFISSIILISSTSSSSAVNKTTGSNANKTSINASLKMSTETPCDRLPLLPLVALAPAHNNSNNSIFNNNNNVSSSNFGDNNCNNASSGNSSSSSMFGFGTSSGDGNNFSNNNNNNNNTAMGRAAKELMSQGNALTDKLKSMFW